MAGNGLTDYNYYNVPFLFSGQVKETLMKSLFKI